MNGQLTVLLTALVLMPPATVASQELFSAPVARVLKVKGTVKIQDREGKDRAADVYGSVRENERLILKANTQITLGFRLDGHMERLTGSCQATVTKKNIVAPVEKIKRIEPPRKHRRFVAGAVKKLRPLSREGTLLLKGADDKMPNQKDGPITIGLVPINASTVLSPQPTLVWPPVAGALAYDVVLSQRDGQLILTETTTKTLLECPEERQLRNGQQYVWEVTAKLEDQGSRLAYRGEFTVGTDLQRSEANQIAELITGSQTEYLALAVSWYESNGLLAEAIDVSRRVAELEPQSASAHQSLATLYIRAGRLQDAKKAWKQANSILSKPVEPARVRSIFDN